MNNSPESLVEKDYKDGLGELVIPFIPDARFEEKMHLIGLVGVTGSCERSDRHGERYSIYFDRTNPEELADNQERLANCMHQLKSEIAAGELPVDQY